jgi:hypothetical protein
MGGSAATGGDAGAAGAACTPAGGDCRMYQHCCPPLHCHYDYSSGSAKCDTCPWFGETCTSSRECCAFSCSGGVCTSL